MLDNKYINRNTQNYWMIGILSLILTVLLPMAGSSVAGLGWNFPNTAAGWAVYVSVKLAATGLNLMIFHHFVLQAKVNIQDDERFIRAEKLLQPHQVEGDPISPQDFFRKQYLNKGFTLTLTTLLSTVCITQAILTFDYVSFIVHIVAAVIAVIFGMDIMRKDEEFWVRDYPKYAEWYVSQQEKKKNEETMASDKDQNTPTDDAGVPVITDTGRVDILVTADSCDNLGSV